MFGEQFYPSPDDLIDTMIKPYLLDFEKFNKNRREGDWYRDLGFHLSGKRSILEPSAGKGNIADRLVKHYHVRSKDVACIELDQELRMILSEKGYRVIDTDFLEYDGDEWFNLIIANPPFAQGAKHLLKAWHIVADDGDVVCVLNAETIKKPYTNERQLLLQVIAEHGRYEFIQQAFVGDAERRTDVEIAVVWLHKPKAESVIDFGEGHDFEKEHQELEEAFTANPLASRDIFGSLVAQYEGAKRAIKEEYRQRSIYAFYTKEISKAVQYSHYDRKDAETLQETLDKLKGKFWEYVFEKTKLGRSTTSEFQKKFDQFSKQTAYLAFSVKNIMQVLEMFYLNQNAILEQCLLATFDKATAYHKDNKIHHEGWKHNESYRVARKIILPYCIDYEQKFNHWRFSYYHQDFLVDIDKVMCFLDGKSLESITTLAWAVQRRIDELNGSRDKSFYSQPFYSTNFKIWFFKKGTMHIEFRDEKLWDTFNRKVAQGKNWIGGDFAEYAEPTPETNALVLQSSLL